MLGEDWHSGGVGEVSVGRDVVAREMDRTLSCISLINIEMKRTNFGA